MSTICPKIQCWGQEMVEGSVLTFKSSVLITLSQACLSYKCLGEKWNAPVVSTGDCLTRGALTCQKSPSSHLVPAGFSPTTPPVPPITLQSEATGRKALTHPRHAQVCLKQCLIKNSGLFLGLSGSPHSEGERGLRKPTIGLTLVHCPESVRCGLAMTASKWGFR